MIHTDIIYKYTYIYIHTYIYKVHQEGPLGEITKRFGENRYHEL